MKAVVIFSVLFLSHFPLVAQQNNFLKKIDYRVELGIAQQFKRIEGRGAAYDLVPSGYHYIFFLPRFQFSAISPINSKFDLGLHSTLNQMGGERKDKFILTNLGLGITPYYRLSNRLKLGIPIEANHILDVEVDQYIRNDGNDDIDDRFNYQKIYRDFFVQSGIRLEYQVNAVTFSGYFLATLTSVLDRYFGVHEANIQNVGISIGYNFSLCAP